MYCANCGEQRPDEAKFCPSCGATTGAPIDSPNTPRPGQNPTFGAPATTHRHGGQQFSFDIKRWGVGDMIVGGASLVLFISLFLPWFSFPLLGGSLSALSVHGWMYLVFLSTLATCAYLVARAIWPHIQLPFAHWQALVAVAAFDLLLTLISFAVVPIGTSWSVGAFIGLLSAIGVLVGAILRRNDPELLPAGSGITKTAPRVTPTSSPQTMTPEDQAFDVRAPAPGADYSSPSPAVSEADLDATVNKPLAASSASPDLIGCKSCGTPNPAMNRFCNSCGESIF